MEIKLIRFLFFLGKFGGILLRVVNLILDFDVVKSFIVVLFLKSFDFKIFDKIRNLKVKSFLNMLEFILDINIEDKIEEVELKIDEEKEKFLDFRGKKRGWKLLEFFSLEKTETIGKKSKKVVDKKFSRLRGDKIIEEEGKSEDSLLVDKKN